ncbi:MAG: UDP-forming cellulose synthase catalytic subunit [Rhizobiales bacterium]|nr:UDP-forming cellulose synthase catalytic subunit [Hyphomicrobiales bacterium]
MIAAVRWILWVASGAVAILLVTQPVSVQAQLSLAVAVIVSMILVWLFGRGPWVRQVLLALGSLVVLRYVYWRTTSTLPPISEFVDFIPGFILYLAEIYCFSILAISLVINADPLHRPRLEETPDDKLPTVDVFIPTYNEDEYILATTIAAAKSMLYPKEKLKVWLCDDGGTDQKCNDKNPEKAAAAQERRRSLMALCEQLGAHYHTRAKNEHAKAGNMNACLKDSDGDLIVVFDADHAPFRMFLRETIGHFLKDEKLFLVQTPHVFLNPDPIEKNLKTFDRMPSENEMFYSVTQRGLDKWDGSFFCGSAAILRRKALEQTGGFSGITITEDCETAFELHASGWHSAYVDKPLIAGLQPETFTSFIGQRSRWCQGMFQIMILKNPALKKGLSFVQRVAYLSSMTFWFFPVPRLIFMLSPLLYIFFDLKLFVSNIEETVGYTLMYLIVNVMIQNYMYGRVRWPWISELYEYVQGVFLAKAIVSVVAQPRKPTFNVTAKGLTLDEDHLSELAWPFFVIYGLLAAGGVTAILRYFFEPGVNNLMLVVSLWNTFNMIIAGAALGAVAERKQPDRHPRLGITRAGVLAIGERRLKVDIVDVSAGGCALRVPHDDALAALAPDQTATLLIDPIGVDAGDCRLPLILRRVESDGKAIKLAFEFPELKGREYYVLADLMYGDSDALPRFLASRRTHKDIFRGSAQFMAWGLLEPFRSFSYLTRDLYQSWRTRGEAAPEADAAPQPAVAPALAPAAVAAPAPAAATLAALLRETTGRDAGEAAPQAAAPEPEKPEPAPEPVLNDPLADLIAALNPSSRGAAPSNDDDKIVAIPTQAAAPTMAAEPDDQMEEDPIQALRKLLERAKPGAKGARIRAA